MKTGSDADCRRREPGRRSGAATPGQCRSKPRPPLAVLEPCGGCGALFAPVAGPVHAYMISSPACFAAFGALLSAEYSDAALLPTLRLTVDTYAVQHTGSADDRRAVQSTGLHLVRLMLQLDRSLSPPEANAVMLGFSRHKATLSHLQPPSAFAMTVAEVAPFAGTVEHAERIRAWAAATWRDWSAHHDYLQRWFAHYGSAD